MKYLCVWLIRFYRKFLSPLKRTPTCRFTPTCSAYAVEAYMKRGFFVGSALTVWRILRCNPYAWCGYDPVPEKRRRYREGEWPRLPMYGEKISSGGAPFGIRLRNGLIDTRKERSDRLSDTTENRSQKNESI